MTNTPTQQFLETHSPDSVIGGLLQLATSERPGNADMAPGSVSISLGSVPRNSEYYRFSQRAQALADQYRRDPQGLIAERTAGHGGDAAQAQTSIENTIAMIPAMQAALQRSDVVYVEFTGMWNRSGTLRQYIEQQAGPGSVLDAGRYTHGIERVRCPQDFPEAILMTRDAFDRVIQPLVQSQQVAAGQTRGLPVDDTTPNDGRATLTYGASLGTARQLSGGCSH